MSYHYTDKTRETEPTALPDVEVFYMTDEQALEALTHSSYGFDAEAGHYYAHGSPGCLWDSDPVGPFDTEEEALKEAREAAGF